MLVFNFISAPSGDEKSIAPLINPPIPITINNNRNIHNEKGTALFELSKIFPFYSYSGSGTAAAHWGCFRQSWIREVSLLPPETITN